MTPHASNLTVTLYTILSRSNQAASARCRASPSARRLKRRAAAGPCGPLQLDRGDVLTSPLIRPSRCALLRPALRPPPERQRRPQREASPLRLLVRSRRRLGSSKLTRRRARRPRGVLSRPCGRKTRCRQAGAGCVGSGKDAGRATCVNIYVIATPKQRQSRGAFLIMPCVAS